MVDYPTDLQLNGDKDIFLDGANDLATVSGVRQLEQSVAIDVMDEIQNFIGGRVTGKNIGLLEERVRQGLNDDPQLSEVRQVNVREYDRRTDEIKIDIIVSQNDDFTIEVSP
jgi:hypothetical protein